MEKDKKDVYIKRLEKPVWSYRNNDGRGSRVFVGQKKAEEALKNGHLVLRHCRIGDLR